VIMAKKIASTRSENSPITSASKAASGSPALPLVRGIRWLTSAIRVRVCLSASATYSTPMPSETSPSASGGDTWTSPTSEGSWPRSNIRGSAE